MTVESTAQYTEELLSLSLSPDLVDLPAVMDRTPIDTFLGLQDTVKRLWAEDMNSIGDSMSMHIYYQIKQPDDEGIHCFYAYDQRILEIICLLEAMRQSGLIHKEGDRLFDESGYLRSGLDQSFWQELIDEKDLLKGITIGIFGGHEGRILARFGAGAVFNVDPEIDLLPSLLLPNLVEIANKAHLIGPTLPTCDVTASFHLFSIGSGLLWPDPSAILYADRSCAKKHLQHILSKTKPGGISLHVGDYVVCLPLGITDATPRRIILFHGNIMSLRGQGVGLLLLKNA